MGMPEQLKQQVAQVDEFYKTQGTEAPEVNPPAAETPTQEVADQSAEVTTQATDNVSTIHPTQAPQEGQQTQPQGSSDDIARLTQQYKSLQGMFNSLDARHRETLGLNEQLRGALATLQAQPAVTAQPQIRPSVTEDEIKEYTPQFFDMLDRYTESKLASVHAQLGQIQQVPQAVNELTQRMNSVASTQAQTDEEKFFDRLQVKHPDWQNVNNSPAFATWLYETDPLSGIQRQVILDDARRRLDLERVASIFAMFKGPSAVTGSVSTNKSLKDELAQQAVVPQRRSNSPAVTSAEKTFTQADMDRLYSDQRSGKYRGREAEFKAAEVALLDAINQGRYTR